MRIARTALVIVALLPGGSARAAGLQAAVQDAAVVEGNSGYRSLSFGVTITGTPAAPLSVHYHTEDSTARTTDGDYLTASGTLVIQPASPQFTGSWGSAGSANGEFRSPYGVAIGPDGTVFVADRDNHRIERFSPDGTWLAGWGSWGTGPGQFHHPEAVGVGPGGEVYVADTGNHRVQQFDASGTFVRAWGTRGGGGAEFRWPDGIAVDANGWVYVVDSGNHRVQKFSGAGEYLGEWGRQGAAPGEFSHPRGIAVSPDGTVIVVDTGNQRVQVFTPEGVWLRQWGAPGNSAGQFRFPAGVATDGGGDVLVADTFNDRIQVFAPDGTWLTAFGAYGAGDGQFRYPDAMARAPDGTMFVADTWGARIERFTPSVASGTISVAVPGDTRYERDEVFRLVLSDPSGVTLSRAVATGTIVNDDRDDVVALAIGDVTRPEGTGGAASFAFPVTVSRAPDFPVQMHYATHDGTATVADGDYTGASGVLSLQPGLPVWQRLWGGAGSGAGQFLRCFDVDVDALGNVYALDLGNHRVQRFAPDGTWLGSWGTYGTGAGQLAFPRGIALAGGNVYVADTGNDRIEKFSASGVFLEQWGSHGAAAGQFDGPQSVAVDTAGSVYVSDSGNSRVQVFTTHGAFLRQWGAYGSLPGQFHRTAAIAIGPANDVYVADPDNQRIQRFTPAGALIGTWGTLGSGPGQFSYPWGVAVDRHGMVYVAESGNHRVQKFDLAGSWLGTWGANGAGPQQFDTPEALAVDALGEVYVADTYNNRVQAYAPFMPSASITVPVATDARPEPNETFTVRLTQPSGAAFDDSVAVGTLIDDDSPLAVTDAPPPLAFALDGANPAVAAATFRYALPARGSVDIAIFDVAGRRVATLVHAERPAGTAQVRWEPRGSHVAGVYEARMKAGAQGTIVRRIVLVR